jgi:hypothetical protein
MPGRCSICRHQQRDSINVSLLRDGTRFTARQFQISRPSLDRHKRHLLQPVPAADQIPEVAASVDGTTSIGSRVETLLRHCEKALSQAQASNNLPGVMRAIRELRAYLELQHKLETEERKNVQAQALHSRDLDGDPGCLNIQEVRAKLFGEDVGASEPNLIESNSTGTVEEH